MDFEQFSVLVKDSFTEVSDTQLEQFRQMDGIYKEWNSKINVISRKDIDGLYSHHVAHSLAIAYYLKELKPEVFRQLTTKGNGTRIRSLTLSSPSAIRSGRKPWLPQKPSVVLVSAT